MTEKELEDIASSTIGSIGWNLNRDYPDLTNEDWAYLEELMSACDRCGTWVSRGELNEYGHCDECEEDEE